MGRFEIILWDVDQTLLDFNKSQEYALRYSFEQFGQKADETVISLYSDINNSYWKRYELGEITKEYLLTGRFATLFEQMGMRNMDAKEFQPVYQKALGSVFYFRDDSKELCRKLKG
ncbi:MAG: noncanonical pyrimidine nucleotidase, partial [Lachnospiraceae bacterium]|nr:noncanonical pyrimidine nucleotidase [Lachnospiraceae bacterium]